MPDMALTFEQLAEQAMALTVVEREKLADMLLDRNGQEGEDDEPLSLEWHAEIQRRIQDIDDGAPTYNADEVMAELKRKYP